MGQARDFLKDATARSHQRLDHSPVVIGLANGSLSTPAYAELMQAYYEFFVRWEKAMRRDHPDLIALLGAERFEKSHWLEADLQILGSLPQNLEIAVPLTVPGDLAGVAGVMYVVEGSTLGGMHLARRGAGFPMSAGTFYQGYGEATVERWKAFVDWLEANLTTPDARERAAATACEAFEWFEKRFARIAHDRT